MVDGYILSKSAMQYDVSHVISKSKIVLTVMRGS